MAPNTDGHACLLFMAMHRGVMSAGSKNFLCLQANQAEKKAAPAARRAQSARSHQNNRSLTPPPAARARSARSGAAATTAAPASAGRARTALSPSPAPAQTRAHPRSPAPRPISGRYSSVQPVKATSVAAAARRQPATVHAAPPPPSLAPSSVSSANRYGGLRPHSAAAARPVAATTDGGAYGGSRKAPMSRSCEPGAWRAYQTSNTVPAALRKCVLHCLRSILSRLCLAISIS